MTLRVYAVYTYLVAGYTSSTLETRLMIHRMSLICRYRAPYRLKIQSALEALAAFQHLL